MNKFFLLLFSVFSISFLCAQENLGCTDPSAGNYNPAAIQADGSCAYDCSAFGDFESI